MDDVEPGAADEELEAEMGDAALSARPEVEFARPRLRVGHELLQRADGQRRGNGDDEPAERDRAERLEILENVEGQPAVEQRVDRDDRVVHVADRVSVSCAPRGVFEREVPMRAPAVLDDDRLAEHVRHPGGKGAPHLV
jgi:hypothetical protein